MLKCFIKVMIARLESYVNCKNTNKETEVPLDVIVEILKDLRYIQEEVEKWD